MIVRAVTGARIYARQHRTDVRPGQPGSMAARDPWRSGRKRPRPPSRACRGQHRGRCDPPRHRASTWKRPTRGCAPHDTGPSRCPSTPMSSSTATASSCSTPARTGRRSPTRATSPAAPPGSSTTASRASTSPPAIRSPPGWRPSATTSPMGELRCCPISTRTTSAGCRSSNAARGTDLALGPSATPAPTGVPVAAGRTACATTGEREAPRWSPLARARRPRVAAARRPGRCHRPRARGPRRARPWPAASRVAGAPRGCASPGRCWF